MTPYQKQIVKLIGEGKATRDISNATGRTPEYINRIKVNLRNDPQYYERKKLPRAKYKEFTRRSDNTESKWAGIRICLGEYCNREFYSEDKRYIHFCTKCRKGKYEYEGVTA